jgi:hypothetical protein
MNDPVCGARSLPNDSPITSSAGPAEERFRVCSPFGDRASVSRTSASFADSTVANAVVR